MSSIKWSENPVGLWIGNVFYSEKIADSFLKNMLDKANKQNLDAFPTDTSDCEKN